MAVLAADPRERLIVSPSTLKLRKDDSYKTCSFDHPLQLWSLKIFSQANRY